MEKAPKTTFTALAMAVILIASTLFTTARAPGVAAQASLTVTKTADTNDGACDTDCSLREAVHASNTTSGGAIIVIPAGRYVLTFPEKALGDASGHLVVSDEVEIIGAGAASTVIDAAGVGRIFDIWEDASLIDVSLVGGRLDTFESHMSRSGGAILHAGGRFRLERVVVRDNRAGARVGATAVRGGDDGGLYSAPTAGKLTIIDSVFADIRAGQGSPGADGPGGAPGADGVDSIPAGPLRRPSRPGSPGQPGEIGQHGGQGGSGGAVYKAGTAALVVVPSVLRGGRRERGRSRYQRQDRSCWPSADPSWECR